jgi:hypothetical protein
MQHTKAAEDWDPSMITAALKLVTQELRHEYNDEPATRIEHEGSVEVAHNPYAGLSDDELQDEIDRLNRLNPPRQRDHPA